MKLGYNTNGLAFHRWRDALPMLADMGYQAVGITVDHNCLDPFADGFRDELTAMQRMLDRLQLASVVETGARFLLNPRVKHEPTLISPTPAERQTRVEFLKRCIDIARELNAAAVSFWSGVLRDQTDRDTALHRLAAGCREVIEYAEQGEVNLAFEPEPGMLIEKLDDFGELLEIVDAPHFGLTMDIGHVQCVEEPGKEIGEHVRQWSDRLFNVHIEDMRRGIHEHLRFGEGEIDFPPVLASLQQIGYSGGLYVELSRHSHMAPEVAWESFEFLSRLMDETD